jgi:hypothetical protein
MINEINIEGIVQLLKSIPNEKEYNTPTIDFARGRYKYKPSFFKKLKNKLWALRRPY